MGKNLRLQFLCILCVAVLTIYNILPTAIYYARPKWEKVDALESEKIAKQALERVSELQEQSLDWLQSFCDLLGVKPLSMKSQNNDAEWIEVSFSKGEEAQKFTAHLQRSGRLINFDPAKLLCFLKDEKTVLVQRQIPISVKNGQDLFSYLDPNDTEYKSWIIDRACHVVRAFAHESISTIAAKLRQDGFYKFSDENCSFSHLNLDFSNEMISLFIKDEAAQEKLVQDIAILKKHSKENIQTKDNLLEITFHSIPDVSGVLALNLEKLAEQCVAQTIANLKTKWNPQHPDLQTISIVDFEGYSKLSPAEKELCLVVFSPFSDPERQVNTSSLGIVVKGLNRLGDAYKDHADSPLAATLSKDYQMLFGLLEMCGFSVHQKGDSFTQNLKGDFSLHKTNFANQILKATRENFKILGNQKFATLDLSTLEQRAIVENKIDSTIHDELVAWKDAYLTNQVSLHPIQRFETPKPTQNVFYHNIITSWKKIWRGDEKKILRWGLDLSGGKSVEIALRDSNSNPVESESDILQGLNELHQKVNKMGLAEVAIRKSGQHIVLDFPGSQALSAQDLIQSSSMYLHVVNEKFSHGSQEFGAIANRFLQRVWDEVLFLGKLDSVTVNKIAYKHLHDKTLSKEILEDAELLRKGGLEFAKEDSKFLEFVDDALSKVVIQRGSLEDFGGSGHPLMIVFHNPCLEGSHLKNIHSSYDPSKGNFLSFEVTSSFLSRDGQEINPQKALGAWTQKYSKESVSSTTLENFSFGRGWRMAVVLNDAVISSPTLDSPLTTGGMISGKFSQSEVQNLCSDLKAGSMTFTPEILSEKNISPELGTSDRMQGIVATIAALLLVIVCMVGYYRFAGIVASMAVIFNLLIMWAVLQNLGAALTLAGIAGIILTVGMSIDANVLVFERMKEEFALTGRIQSAIQEGYKKAFSAILDSNVTTIIAALILLNFDAGPIKSFATNLIIGIASSMFTALFVTRFYFTMWAKNPQNKELKMNNLLTSSSFDFLAQTKKAFMTAFIVIGLGMACLAVKSSSILGLDFTGGYSMTVDVQNDQDQDALILVKKALTEANASPQDFQIQQLSSENQLRIFLSQNLEESGKPFHGLALEKETSDQNFLIEKNPRALWLIDAIKNAGLEISDDCMKNLHLNWSSVSGQMSNAMKTHALIGFLLSFVGIFIYLAIRFEYKFAAAAIGCLIHDVFITLGIMGLLHFVGVPVQIDLITIAALMTAVGYSLNDTIIIFDRIREEMQAHPRKGIKGVVNHALNFTLSRTIITSGSTLLVLLALLILGGSSIFGFALVMTLGVILGTMSSWFIAAPLMLYFHKKESPEVQIV